MPHPVPAFRRAYTPTPPPPPPPPPIISQRTTAENAYGGYQSRARNIRDDIPQLRYDASFTQSPVRRVPSEEVPPFATPFGSSPDRVARRHLGAGLDAIANAARYAHQHQHTTSSHGVGNPYTQATQAMRAAANAAAVAAAASPRGNGGQAMMMAAAADLMSKGHGSGLGAAVRAFGGAHAAVTSSHPAVYLMHGANGLPGLVPIPRATMAARPYSSRNAASAPRATAATSTTHKHTLPAAAAHSKAAADTRGAGTSAPRMGGAAAGSSALLAHARVTTPSPVGSNRGGTARTAARSRSSSKSKSGGGGKAATGSSTKAKATRRKSSSPTGGAAARQPSYNGASAYTAEADPAQPGGPNRVIKTGGVWSTWVLECGAKERNVAIREFKLSDEDVVDLKKTSRRMKLLFAQRRYLAGLRKREAEEEAAESEGGTSPPPAARLGSPQQALPSDSE